MEFNQIRNRRKTNISTHVKVHGSQSISFLLLQGLRFFFTESLLSSQSHLLPLASPTEATALAPPYAGHPPPHVDHRRRPCRHSTLRSIHASHHEPSSWQPLMAAKSSLALSPSSLSSPFKTDRNSPLLSPPSPQPAWVLSCPCAVGRSHTHHPVTGSSSVAAPSLSLFFFFFSIFVWPLPSPSLPSSSSPPPSQTEDHCCLVHGHATGRSAKPSTKVPRSQPPLAPVSHHHASHGPIWVIHQSAEPIQPSK